MKKLLALALFAAAFISCKKETTTTTDVVNNDTITKTEEPVANNTGYIIGDEATDFSLKGTDDKMYSLAQFEDAKGFIVIFTCNHCPYAKAYEDRIIALDKKYKALGYPVIAINPNDPAEQPEDSFEMMKERARSEEHTSELQSRENLVCRLLLEKKK